MEEHSKVIVNVRTEGANITRRYGIPKAIAELVQQALSNDCDATFEIKLMPRNTNN